MLTVSARGNVASSEESFIVTMVKLAKGFCNVELADLFGFGSDVYVSIIYHFMIDLLDNKARGLLYDGAACLQRWAHLFPDFAEIIS